ncbi:DoxX family protein [Streptomyces virginiae]|uniref:DoxX family protein n=1 Tax=Streptomyces TaxID=1883 RepID=UPI0005258F17|nr:MULTISPECIES: DoxX family protein [Streptomyces]MCX5272309.1 DoxX family protein [Streptomyces virginiae]MYV79854.1 DoxX family protein [Streptomyces sp. SID1046]WSC78500.1 DoxX family protein [Streptomyces virginiae]
MSTTAVVFALVGAFMVGFSAASMYLGAKWVVEPLVEYGVPRSWWTPLATAKAAGAVGLAVGVFVPAIGVAAAIGVALYFAGAVITVLRAKSYAHVAFPVIYAAPAVVALALGFNG